MLPTEAEFKARGLLDVEIDPPAPSSSPMVILHQSAVNSGKVPNADWTSGSCRLYPTPDHPCILERPPGTLVRWHFCPAGDSLSSLYFRRQAQVKALDTVPDTLRNLGTAPNSPSNSETQSQQSAGFPRRYRPPAEIIAWWEDSLGYWLIVEGQQARYRPFVDAWADVVGPGWPLQGTNNTLHGGETSKVIANGSNGTNASPIANESHTSMSQWADACDLLAQVVVCLQALHDRHMSLNWCHPSCFVMLGNSVIAHRLWDTTALPGLSLHQLLTPELAASPLFTRDPIHHSSCNLTEGYVFRHLRYLAPEAAISRRVSPSNDIYGWGVLAYELLTGRTIDGRPDCPDLEDVDLLADVHRHVTNEVTPPAEYLEQLAKTSPASLNLPPRQLSDIIMLALAKDPEDRYHSLEPLVYDLRKLSQICRANGDLSKFTVGEVDRMSRFNLPHHVIERDAELSKLDTAFTAVAEGVASSRIVAIWGPSGNGKTRLVEDWANALESSAQGNRCLIGWAKPDEHVKKPLSSFVQVIQSLLDRVLTDPREDSKAWLKRIHETLGTQWAFFVSLLSPDARRLLNEDAISHPTIETEKFLASFRSWSRRFLQLFGTAERPLVVIVDDTQWLAPDEIEIWRDILDSAFPLNHTMVIYMTRSQGNEPPPPTLLLSSTSICIPVRRLTEEGVSKFIDTCLNGRVSSSGDAIASFLYGETGGSPLFLQTLMTTLLKEQVVAFDYDSLQWRFDLVALQSHLSDASFDAYLENMMRRQPPDVQDILMLMAYLPAVGFPLNHLASVANMSLGEVENLVQLAAISGTLSLRNNHVRFTHDRQRVAAQSFIPVEKLGHIHKRIFNFLSCGDVKDDYLFEAMDHALIARKFGTDVAPVDVLTNLLLDATERATLSANFSTAKHFVTSAEDIVNQSGGIAAWAEQYRPLCFRFVRLYADIASVFHDHDIAFHKLEMIKPLCVTSTEKITIATLLVRQLVAANQHLRAIDVLLSTLDEFGYNPETPKAVDLWVPTSAKDVEELGDLMRTSTPAADDEDHVLIMSLISYAGPTIYVTLPERRYAIFKLGLSVTKALGRIHKSASYLLAVHCVTIHNAQIQRALIKLSKEICDLYPASLFTSSSLILVAAQSSFFTERAKISELFDAAFDASVSLADYEVAAYVVGLDLSAALSWSTPPQWDVVARRYEMVKPYATNSHLVLNNSLIQQWENLARAHGSRPWELDGPFYGLHDLDMIKGLKFQPGVADTLKLRLQLLYDAPAEVMRETLASARKTFMSTFGLPVGIEMRSLMAFAQLRLSDGTDLVEACREFLEPYTPYSPDLRARYKMLSAMELVHRDPLAHLSEIEQEIDSFDADKQYLLSGLLNYCVGDMLIKKTGSTKLAVGFIRAAFTAYNLCEATGVCVRLRDRFPGSCPSTVLTFRPPSDFFQNPELPPPLRRASTVSKTETITSNLPARSEHAVPATDSGEAHNDTMGSTPDNLDTLALMRSSLALAQEKDSLVLLCTLLRILCQFSRCDYAAIALSNEEDRSTFRLKAAGPFQRIVSYDLDIADDAAVGICPSTIMLHVARTGIPIRKPVTTSRLRHDPFYNDRQPRTLLCLPIHHQGVPSGVIVLLSMNSASSAVQSESACEVVTTLATFAYIIHLHQVFTQRLKTEVEQRTRELTSALRAKTQFLSQCSHELRSPLAAIMGLAAVLEANPGLTAIQREHLQTISNSGQDLLALISNILDHSKLESNSVLLENIPFSVRQVVEGALDTIAPVAQSKNVELTASSMFKNEAPGLMGDPFRIKQVLLNLMSNAVKFTPPNEPGSRRTARVTVDRSWEVVDDDKVKVTLVVEDTGVGIPASKLHKLFKSFSQVDESITRSYGGSGLGLVISRDLARLLGGDCTVESEFGKGSKFTFTFVAQRDPKWKPTPLRRFDTTRTAFILTAPGMLWGKVLEEDLRGFNCSATLFADSLDLVFKPEYPGGLATGQQFDFVLLDASYITREHLATIKSLQPKSTFIYVSRATEIAKIMERLQIPRESIISRPLKFQSLQDCLVPIPSGPRKRSGAPNRPNIDKTLGKHNPLSILVVDDSFVNISVCTRILELYGYSGIDSAVNGMQATEMAERKRYDLILLDLQMPVMDGFEALKRIKSSPLAGEPCCVSLSANVDKATQSRCFEVGFFAVLSKPVDIPKLGQILCDVYAHRKGATPVNGQRALPTATTAAPQAGTARIRAPPKSPSKSNDVVATPTPNNATKNNTPRLAHSSAALTTLSTPTSATPPPCSSPAPTATATR